MSRLTIDPMLRQAVSHQQAGRLAEAEGIYQQILRMQPKHAEALHLLGVLASQSAQYERACELISQAIAISPRNAAYHRHLGRAFRHRGMIDATMAAWQTSISLNPNQPDLLNSLGTAWNEQGQLQQAIVCFRRAIGFKPTHHESHYNLGCALEEKGDVDQAVACYQRVLELRPDYCQANNNLGRIWKDKGNLDESIACYRRAIEADPQFVVAHQNLIFAMQYQPGTTTQSLAGEVRKWSDQFAKPLAGLIAPHANDRNPDRRLRIGYVSPDFRAHVVARFYISNLLEYQDRNAFEIFCYSEVAKPDAMTVKFQGMSDHWRSTVGMSDEQVAEKIREDRIDILADLALHTANNRLLVFARRPAPVQVTLGGYPGSTGLEAMDYRLTDPYLDPPGVGDDCYCEKSVRMPETFWCDPAIETEPAVGPLPAQANGFVTFGSLNNFCKMNDPLLLQWARILNGVKNSRLIVLAPAGDPRSKVLDVLGAAGIDPDRVECLGMQKRPDYLATYNRMDIGLDPWPYGGHSTSFDSFWMGVPVVTWVGETVVGRAGLSQLSNLNLSELVGYSPDEYVRIAIDLANDLGRLSDLRRTMRERMKASALMDGGRFVKGIEGVYREAWRRWCSGE
jgi:predicted O-linked N-acetylglucosamine transferase (SPINDLY family)